MTDKELREHRETINICLDHIVDQLTLKEKPSVYVIRNEVAEIIEAYKGLRRQIRSLADKQEIAYKEHIKKEYTNII